MGTFWHRARGHKITHKQRRIYFDGSMGNIEGGRTDYYLVCSCGTRWRHENINPLNNKWEWVRC